MAKRNIWVLPMNEKYEIKSILYADDAVTFCKNCGRLIKNVALVQNSKWEVFEVWLDCAETLEQHEVSNYRQHQENKRAYRRYVKIILSIKKKIKENEVTKVERIADTSSGLPSFSYRVWYGLWGKSIWYIWTYHVYKSTREKFWQWIEKNFKDTIVDYVRPS